MTPNGSRGTGNHQQQQQQQQPHQGGSSPHWELNRLSTTGRHFLLEPESRTGIVQDLQHRLQREQRKRRELQLRSNNNTQQQQQQKSADEDKQQSETPAASAADEQLEVQESSIEAETSRPVMATSIATVEAESVSPAELGQDSGRSGSRLKTLAVAPKETAPDQAFLKKSGAAAKSAETHLVGAPAAADSSEPDKQSTTNRRRNQGSVMTKAPSAAAPADADDSDADTSERQRTTRRKNQTKTTRRAQLDEEYSMPDRQEGTVRLHNPRTARARVATQVDEEDAIPDTQVTPSWRNDPRSTARSPVAARTQQVQVQVAAEDSGNNKKTTTTTRATEPAPAVAFEGGSAADRLASMRRYSQRSTAATTTAATDTGGQASTVGLPTQPTPPCLPCLMRSLHESGLLGSCWMTAVLELEEAFTIKDVADAYGSRFVREGEVGLKQLTMVPRRAPSRLQMPGSVSQGVVISSGEGSAATPLQADVSKWQALERLCHLRNSLRECPHLIES